VPLALRSRSLLAPLALLVGAAAALALVSACADDEDDDGASPTVANGTDAGADRGAPVSPDASGEVDARADASTCALTRAYTLACNLDPDAGDPLTCGAAKFERWCDANDRSVNSAAFRRAEGLCLSPENCDGYARRDCEYRSYATATPTAAQTAVVAAYCQTCEPSNPGCPVAKAGYDPSLGPKSTDDVFVAAWELNDAIDDAIRSRCTGAALDAGAASPDAAPCEKAFGACAAEVYLNAVPNCP
jgi:hypothetical protein